MTKLQIGERVWCRIDGVERRCRIARVRICATPNVDWPNLYLVQVESSGLRVWVSPENVSVLIDDNATGAPCKHCDSTGRDTLRAQLTEANARAERLAADHYALSTAIESVAKERNVTLVGRVIGWPSILGDALATERAAHEETRREMADASLGKSLQAADRIAQLEAKLASLEAVPVAFDAAFERGREAERAAVVALLVRELNEWPSASGGEQALTIACQAIEAGRHLEGGT